MPPDWPLLVQRVREEVSTLSNEDRAWLSERIASIEELQLSLDKLFSWAGGFSACAACDGSCCACGKHHLTLTNLLAYLLAEETPPTPAFDSPCPFLGCEGCLLPVARRPYNCITFFCEVLEDRLDDQEKKQLRALDHQLRREYQRVEERYPAASLRGLWIAMERIGEGPLLQRLRQVVVK